MLGDPARAQLSRLELLPPAHPKSPIRFGENGAVFFTPELSRYEATEIKPHVSGCVTTPDYFERLVDAINRKGLVFLRLERLLL